MNLFNEFSTIIILSVILGILSIKLKQPPILGYILTGFLLGPLIPGFNLKNEGIVLLSDIGITLLLFTLGLELNLSELKRIGLTSVITGISQVLFTSILGFFISLALGFNFWSSFFISICLTFSSTIIILKLLGIKNELDSLHGKISIGFLLVQDIIAILILILISTFKEFDLAINLFSLINQILLLLIKTAVLVFLIYFIAEKILFRIMDSLKQEKEMLFLISVGWALLLASIFSSEYIGFTKEIGGLLAGIVLSNRFEHFQLSSWTRPLRDFFLSLFFVLLGGEINLNFLVDALVPVLIFSLFIIIGNPLIVMIIMNLFGFKSKVSFLTSLSVAQISEFSLIVISFVYKELGLVDNLVLTIMTLVGGITMLISSYMIYYNYELYNLLKPLLKILEFKSFIIKDLSKDLNDPAQNDFYLNKKILLIGCHRMGDKILNFYSNLKDQILILDIDPFKLKTLKNKGYDVILGDIGDVEFLNYLNLSSFSIIISTVPFMKDNKTLLNFIDNMKNGHNILKIVTAISDNDAKILYENGADFVIYPHFIASEIIRDIVNKQKLTRKIRYNRQRFLGNLVIN